MAFRVFIDPGHGGTDPGAVFNGRQEKDDVLRLALAVGRILEENGIDVVYSRTEDFYDSPYEKAMKGNESEADLFLSVHRNAAVPSGSGTGADILVYSDTGFSADAARQIGMAIEAAGLAFNGVTERPNLAVLRRTKMPAVLVEAGFLDNERDNLFFDENFDALANAIAQGVLNAVNEEHGTPSVLIPEDRTDHPENGIMNADLFSAFANADPAEQIFEEMGIDFPDFPDFPDSSDISDNSNMPYIINAPDRPDAPGRPGTPD
ncbi:MAG: N-acetylmuramoyl-L-alanine amidase, partial [Lachnospiraceae bacterium]|nr:N-acetylmuramoyl-L-alanine amidase [Lachnospiraceae bacterium]